MTAAEARKRTARLAADLIADEASVDVFAHDDDGKLLPEADRRRMEAAVERLAAELRRRSGP